MEKNDKLKFSVKFGYGIASFGDSVFYSVVIVFLVYYLTAVVGMEPGPAGTIASVGLLISAFVTFFVGHFSDNSKNPVGRRRPFIKFSFPIMAVAYILIFTNFGFSGTAQVAYYAIVVTIFWCFYNTIIVTYTALGAELSDDYAERITIRSYSAICIQVAAVLSLSAPLFFASFMMERGMDQSTSWTISNSILGVIGALTLLICVITTKGHERIISDEDRAQMKNMLKNFKYILKAKPTKYLLLAFIIFLVMNAIFASNLTFYAIYYLGLDGGVTSSIYAMQFGFGACLAPLINLLAQKTDKRTAFVIIFTTAAILVLILTVIGANSYILLVLLAVVFQFSNAGYWQLSQTTMYDVAEVVELQTGFRLEGSLSSLQTFLISIGGSIAGLVLGWSLQLSGFVEGAEVQVQSALDTIVTLQTIVPVCGCLIIAATMYFFPINKKRYALIQQALKDKKEKGEYSTEGLERVL